MLLGQSDSSIDMPHPIVKSALHRALLNVVARGVPPGPFLMQRGHYTTAIMANAAQIRAHTTR